MSEAHSRFKRIRLTENKHYENRLVESHHHHVYQVLYALENKGQIMFENAEYQFLRNNVAFITPYSDHSIRAESDLVVLVLEFDAAVLDSDICDVLLKDYLNSTRLIDINIVIAGEVRQLLRRMLYEQSVGGTLNELNLKILLAELLLTLARSREEKEFKDADDLRAKRLRDYLDTHYFEAIDATEISTRTGISVRHINTIFKESYHMTPMQYLTKIRIEIAKRMLIETDKDIVSICFEIGFESLSTFYRAFKQYTEFSPKVYRDTYQIEKFDTH